MRALIVTVSTIAILVTNNSFAGPDESASHEAISRFNNDCITHEINSAYDFNYLGPGHLELAFAIINGVASHDVASYDLILRVARPSPLMDIRFGSSQLNGCPEKMYTSNTIGFPGSGTESTTTNVLSLVMAHKERHKNTFFRLICTYKEHVNNTYISCGERRGN